MITLAFAMAIYTTLFLHRAITAQGIVISLRPIHSDDGDTYAPVFTYAASGDKVYTVSSDTGASPPAFSLGQKVEVLYEKSDPTGAKIASFWQLWLFPVVGGFLGLTATGVGYGLLRYERRRNPQFSLIPSWWKGA